MPAAEPSDALTRASVLPLYWVMSVMSTARPSSTMLVTGTLPSFGLPLTNGMATGVPEGVDAVHSSWPDLVSVTFRVLEAPFPSITGMGITLELPGATPVGSIGASYDRLPVRVNFEVAAGARLMPIGSLMLPGAPATLTAPCASALQPCTIWPLGVVSEPLASKVNEPARV